MSQEQPRRPHDQAEPVRYGDVFNVSGELASKPIAPVDAAVAQAAENKVLGKTIKGGPAAVMQSAADTNAKAGVLGPESATNAAREGGVCITQSDEGGTPVVTESIAGEVVGKYASPKVPTKTYQTAPPSAGAITIGEALEVASLSAGGKAVDKSDAAAVQAAETRATGGGGPRPGGVAAATQSAAAENERTLAADKIPLSEVLKDARERLPSDKPVTGEDAERVVEAEMRNDPDMKTTPGGVAESVASAARINRA